VWGNIPVIKKDVDDVQRAVAEFLKFEDQRRRNQFSIGADLSVSWRHTAHQLWVAAQILNLAATDAGKEKKAGVDC